MSSSDVTENALLNLIFRGVAWANYADNAASSPETTIAFAAHTADPGDAGTMATSEVAYTSYSRASKNRNTTDFTAASSGSIGLATELAWPAGTGGTGTITHFSAGKSGGGAAAILVTGTVTPNITCGNAITPKLAASTTISVD